MTVGDTKNLYFFHGDSASAYFSSNPNIASVTTGGVLNANDVGSAEIIYSVHGVFHQRKINVADIENPSFSTTQRENLILPDNALTTTDPVLFMQKRILTPFNSLLRARHLPPVIKDFLSGKVISQISSV